MDVHADVQIYNCHKCDDSFELSGDLATHVLLHSGEMAFNCELCDFSINTLDRLKTHMAIHNEEKPFSCKQCKYICNQAGQLPHWSKPMVILHNIEIGSAKY